MDQNTAKTRTIFVGTVSWFDAEKEVGFIQRRAGPDIFVQFQDVMAPGFKSLTVGQKVEFTVLKTERGLVAKNVVPC